MFHQNYLQNENNFPKFQHGSFITITIALIRIRKGMFDMTKDTKGQKITIDQVEYNIDDLSENAKKNLVL